MIIKSLEMSDYSKLMEMYLDSYLNKKDDFSKRHIFIHVNGLIKRLRRTEH